MIAILETNDHVRLNYLQTVLADAGLHPFIFEGVAPYPGAQPRRLMVPESEADQARRVMRELDA
ncbi:MAG: DUF2007 domain-containing protein [Alphaproteobacteria bacterium]|nr:DUF2007 domain-containing protein [Alphaproteobacteria bacterium]